MTNLRSAGGFRFSNLPTNLASTSAATSFDAHAVASNTREAAYSSMSPASIAARVQGGTGNASGTAHQGDQRDPFRGELSLVTNDATRTVERQFPTARRSRA
ncbi:hypothetical protein GCM10009754_45520 [Amycolatopsis minnesotensis]|uniref:Uncharacterized protein n=1 Tax=Amycolatopsis minnesotensis TaxID=337894 RepID=A0ABN2RE82_9PSEU